MDYFILPVLNDHSQGLCTSEAPTQGSYTVHAKFKSHTLSAVSLARSQIESCMEKEFEIQEAISRGISSLDGKRRKKKINP